MTKHVALLRGINVGGRARLAMADLRRLFVELGHREVTTYIQSGNVVFEPAGDGERSPNAKDLARAVERRIADDLGMTVTVMVRSRAEVAAVHGNNPFVARGVDLGALYVAFLAEEPNPARLAGLQIPAGERVEFHPSGSELYLYYPDGYGTTKVSNTYIEKRLGVAATTRNWRTMTKLHELATLA